MWLGCLEIGVMVSRSAALSLYFLVASVRFIDGPSGAVRGIVLGAVMGLLHTVYGRTFFGVEGGLEGVWVGGLEGVFGMVVEDQDVQAPKWLIATDPSIVRADVH